jgi:hypothetical protein
MTNHSGIGFSQEHELRPPQEGVLGICKVPCYAPYIRFRKLYSTTVEREFGMPLPSLITASGAAPAAVNKQVLSIGRLEAYGDTCASALRYMDKDEIHGFLGL